ncbi:MAG: ABC transporter permease [Gammaproteobacteria bacterium]
MHLAAFIFRRLLQGALVMLVISAAAFAVRDELGDPLRELVGESVSEEERELLREEMGLRDPFAVQYWRFLKNAARGDFGDSYFFKRPALDVILEKFPATFELVFAASLIIFLISAPAGVYCALRPHSAGARAIMFFSILGISVPVFLFAILLIYLFSVQLGWLPSYGRGDIAPLFGVLWESNFATWSGLAHLLLPAAALSSIMLPLFIRLIRAEMAESLSADYIRFARAKGLHPRRIYFVHALKNAMLPVITVGGVQIGSLLAYTILTESVFQWPGMGFLFLEAVNRVDPPLIVAYLIVAGLIFVAVNTAADVVCTLANPAVRLGDEKA